MQENVIIFIKIRYSFIMDEYGPIFPRMAPDGTTFFDLHFLAIANS